MTNRLSEICAAAGMSSGNLFHYFSSKREIFAAIFEDDASDKSERLAAAQASDDPWTALFDVVDVLAAPAAEPLAPNLVLEAMIQAYRDPALAELLGRNDAEERAAIAALLAKAVRAGQIDPALDPVDTASWIMAVIGALFLEAATNPKFNPAKQLSTLRLMLQRFLRIS
ncbi:MAG: TetR/AcrR family transcriptional regulator [Pseudonocardiaceae bacterium]